MTEHPRLPLLRPTETWPGEADAWMLLCPICGFDYTHHNQVDVFERIGGEDGPTLQITVDGAQVTVAPSDENPSSRRGAVAIQFYGECGHTWDLTLVQHKGTTFVQVARMPRSAPWPGAREARCGLPGMMKERP